MACSSFSLFFLFTYLSLVFFSSVVFEVFVFGLFLSFRELECFIILPCWPLDSFNDGDWMFICVYECMRCICLCALTRPYTYISLCACVWVYDHVHLCRHLRARIRMIVGVVCVIFFNVNYCVLGDKLWNCLFFFISLCAALTLVFIFAMMLICVYVYVRISTHVYVYFCVVVFAFWWHISDASHLFLCSNNFSVILKSYLYSLFNFNNVIYS